VAWVRDQWQVLANTAANSESLGLINCFKFLEWLSVCLLLKMDTAAWS
jgi:hypothetical protein